MTAQAMFEALGYKKIKNHHHYDAHFTYQKGKKAITFIWAFSKSIIFKGGNKTTPQLDAAIAQQLKELGWKKGDFTTKDCRFGHHIATKEEWVY